jgi:phosphoglycerol transferase MdoB-like AlkP superfamily enzyme
VTRKLTTEKTIRFGAIEWWIWQSIILLSFYLFLSLVRIVFLFWNPVFHNFGINELLLTFYHGFKLDLSMAAYASMVLYLFSIFLFGKHNFYRIFGIITGIILVFFTVLSIADAELYQYWGFKIDVSLLKYLKTPKEAMASVSFTRLGVFIFLFVALTVSVTLFVQKVIPLIRLSFTKVWQINGLLALPLLFLCARGSLDVSAVNVSSAYFSQHQALNHAAINASWNFMNSLVSPQRKMNVEWDDSLSHYLSRFQQNCEETVPVFAIQNTNVIVVVLESFTANLIDYKVNNRKVTPNLNRIAREGYFFPNCYATGNRSDKGLAAIFSGFPAHPHGSIMQYPEKFSKIGSLALGFRNRGYQTRFYYGGNADFANFKGFLISNGFEKVIEQSDFPYRQRTSKWGVQDDVVMERFFNDISNAPKPLFYSVFTLSSHEPFEVPYISVFSDGTTLGNFLNSISFTDSVLGVFYDKFKASPMWDNSLLVFVADHGHYLPLHSRHEEPSHYRIPLIFGGGALMPEFRKKENPANISQTDIPKTISLQFGILETKFAQSRNFLCKNYAAPVGYIFNFGYGIITPQADTVVFDAGGNRLIKYGIKDSTWIPASDAWFRKVLNGF